MKNLKKLTGIFYVSLFTAVFGLLTLNNTFAALNAPAPEDPYSAFAEVMPEPVGGMAAVVKKISYPEMARKNGIEGKVYVLVMVNEKGGVDDVKVIRGIGAGCDEAAIRAVKESKFNPGKSKGAPVKVKLSLPISFKL
jgi:TonB family C-terminal domain